MKAGAPEPDLLRSQPHPPREFAHLIAVAAQFPSPIDWTALEAWARMRRRTFRRWELDVLAQLDRMRLT